MSFGGETVTIVTVGENPSIRDRHNKPTKTEVETTVTGCRFRPMPAREVIEDGGDKVADPWKLTAPPAPAVVNAKSGDEIKYNGITYQVTGLPRVHTDLAGRAHHVTVLAARYLG